MVVLFAVGLMNLGWMMLLAAVIFAEKIFRHGPLIGRLAGLGLVLFGLATLAAPWLGRPASMPFRRRSLPAQP
jgi:predicted metal-binding membrane protein